MFRSSETKIKLNIKEVILIFYVYIGYLAAVNIAAFLAYILDFDFKRDAVKKGDEAGAAVFSAAGGAPAIIFMSLTYRKSPLPWYAWAIYIAAFVLHLAISSVLFSAFFENPLAVTVVNMSILF